MAAAETRSSAAYLQSSVMEVSQSFQPGSVLLETKPAPHDINKEVLIIILAMDHGFYYLHCPFTVGTIDRTPKQKLKVKVTAEPLLAMFLKYKDGKGKQAKLKTPMQLQELLDVTKEQLQVISSISYP